jgi:hypothetical protein
MLRLAKAFLNIALWRQTPADLPASLLLLALAAGTAALTEVLGALLPPPPNDQLVLRVTVEVAMPLLFAWVLLTLARRRERFLQTGTALMGVGALAAVLLYPLASLTGVLGDQNMVTFPLDVLSTALLIGYLLACAHIWRSALDSSFLLGVIISFGYFIFSISVSRQVLLQS